MASKRRLDLPDGPQPASRFRYAGPNDPLAPPCSADFTYAFDLAIANVLCKVKPGDDIEVKWYIAKDGENETQQSASTAAPSASPPAPAPMHDGSSEESSTAAATTTNVSPTESKAEGGTDDKEGGDNRDEEEEEAGQPVWFRATVEGPDGEKRDPSGRRLWKLCYAPLVEFSGETASVSFITRHLLFDPRHSGLLSWRREGEDYEDEEEEHELSEQDSTLEFIEGLKAQEACQLINPEEMAGSVLEGDLGDQLRGLPMTQQIQVVDHIKSITKRFKERLRDLVATKGAEYVLTAGDVQSLERELREARQRLRQGNQS
ncbi:unnamed protein product [Vitrella brassicaformis CCMP3155]|uniref:Uncharacterized protein n=1 Tax=Vitrella brassicaformis (strain CCMP3155) TaxID=1169540 RepID=A0A0G4GWE8_VITBC|nr:unnamed protein product [Vitrella brassicaformis CCMP3155]|eukprot:CEM35333.1 unnamed protein product [Vitrella brassicaformis CCMP3155]